MKSRHLNGGEQDEAHHLDSPGPMHAPLCLGLGNDNIPSNQHWSKGEALICSSTKLVLLLTL